MTKVFRKVCSLFLVGVILLSTTGTTVFAKEINEVDEMLEWMEANGTSRVKELEEMLDEFYEELNKETDPVQIDQYEKIILSTEKMLELAIKEDFEGIQPLAVINPCNHYIVAAATITAYFRSKGYTLSSKMLNYAFSNKSTSSVYVLGTEDKNKIMTTNWYKSVKGKYPAYGTSAFGDVMDLYYSINKFSYSPSSMYGYLNISDRYDYEFDTSYPTATGVAVNMMAIAQGMGCLVPYKVTSTIKVI